MYPHPHPASFLSSTLHCHFDLLHHFTLSTFFSVGMQRSASQRQVKKVNVPLVPDIPGMHQQTNGSTSPVPPPPSMTGQENRPYATCTIPSMPASSSSSSSSGGSNGGTLSRHSTGYSQYGSLGSTNHSSFLVPNQHQQLAEHRSSPSLRSQST